MNIDYGKYSDVSLLIWIDGNGNNVPGLIKENF